MAGVLGRQVALTAILSATGAPLRDTTGYTFQEYLLEFSKGYQRSEFASREELFSRRLLEVNDHNAEYLAGRRKWYSAVNDYTDWNDEELQSIKRTFPSRSGAASGQPPAALDLSARSLTPLRIDWREREVMTPVRSQGGCGSCWAFSAAVVLEAHLAIATGTVRQLSPQALVNCVQNPDECGGSGGCSGATMELAFDHVTRAGIPLESAMPYSREGTCVAYSPFATIGGFAILPTNNAQALETALAVHGPVSVTLAANWGRYGGGIFEGGCSQEGGCTIDHGVVAIGYDRTEAYWLVRNSWGASWGEQGHIRLSRANDAVTYTNADPAMGTACRDSEGLFVATQTVGGECGILFDTSYPTGVALASSHSVTV